MMTEGPWNGFAAAPSGEGFLRNPEVFEGKRILITGAGGYIGSEIARSLFRLPVEHLLLLDIAEHGLYSLDRDFQTGGVAQFEIVLGSVCDRALLNEIFDAYRPEIVYHVAALKHVPLLESNPFAAAQTNVVGTENVVECAREFDAEQLILLSTDKAVDPIGIMGATKRLAELIVLASRGATRTKAVRLCNVIGSSGSVAPLFTRQIEQGRPVTVTHPEATRHFLTLAAAVQCLLWAAAHECATGIAIPQVGEPQRIEDLALFLLDHVLAAEAASIPASDIIYTGLRAGDKLHEHMISPREVLRRDGAGENSLLLDVESPSVPPVDLDEHLKQIGLAIEQRDLARLLRSIQLAVPEYAPGSRLWRQTEKSPAGTAK